MSGKPDLAALVASRLCHDLISPIGAISNGLELLAMGPLQNSPEMEMIAQSVASASTRIRFARVAFGPADPQQILGAEEIRLILAEVAKFGRAKIEWRSSEIVLRQNAKIAFLMILCLESAMPYGGRIVYESDASGHSVRCEAERLKLQANDWSRIQRRAYADDVDSAHVHIAILGNALNERGVACKLVVAEKMIRFAWT